MTDAGQIDFYFGIPKPSADEIAAAYDRLEISPEGLFPLTYRPDVSLSGGPPGGTLLGFYHLEVQRNDKQVKYSR